MTNRTHEQILKDLEKLSREILESEQKSIEFLIKIGVYNSEGELSENYSRNPYVRENKDN